MHESKGKQDTQKTEQEILKFWESKKIYDKSKKKNSKGEKFYFMDGPPYATGHIHMGTALNKILKDIATRAKRLQGRDVFDRPGYDTHGVPIEFQVEKEIGSRGKQDIEKYGVKKFVEKCKNFATRFIDVMNDDFKDLGVWMDWNNPYLTLSEEYIESIWGVFKEAEEKDLLYLGKYPVHVCPRCETAVAFNEIEYGKQKDTAIYVKFPLKNKKNTFLIIWTTTPWTLPGNTGVMVNPEVIYQEIEMSSGERWIVAKEIVPELMRVLESGYTAKKEHKGKEMLNWEYENPLARNINLKVKNAYKVVLSTRYVTTTEGTGLVHSAPGHGKEDFEVGREYGLDMPSPVSSSGLLTEEAGKYAGKKAREVDTEIISDLEKLGYLVYKHEYEHDYPLCWRDKTPLLMISQPQWFLKISAIQKKMLKENEKVKWVPKWMQAKMKAWLEGVGDWPVSRQRYWGTPLPIWYDPSSGERVVIGSVAELEKLSGVKRIGLHKPEIDNIKIKSPSGKILQRVPEVLDVWFDSGVSSWAALGYPRDKKNFKKYWPADLNIEGRDQFRGWWNSQLILSEIMFDKKPYDAISVHGMVLDLEKKKMSKSKGNIVAPKDVISQYGRDYLRYYFAKMSKGEDFSYDEKIVKDIGRVFMMINNVNNYVNQLDKTRKVKSALAVEDTWVLSRFNSVLKRVEEAYDNYVFFEVIQKIEDFLIKDLSRTYIQMIRDRSDEKKEVLSEIRAGLLQIFSPIVPFLTEKIWQELRKQGSVKEESIHLTDWPRFDSKKINNKLEKSFELALRIIESGLRERDSAQIGLKWPLAKAEASSPEEISEEVQEIIARQLNVKKIVLKIEKDKEIRVKLDTKMTPELEAEGYSREFARNVQEVRKKSGLKKQDVISLKVNTEDLLKHMLEKHLEFIKQRTNSKKVDFAVGKTFKKGHEFSIKGKKVSIEI